MDCECVTFKCEACIDCGKPMFEETEVKKSPTFAEPKEEETEE
jgi:hypothetical protein